jgi:hypothetical protein
MRCDNDGTSKYRKAYFKNELAKIEFSHDIIIVN